MAVLLSGTTIGGNAAIHAGNISTYALTSVPSNVITTSGGQTIAGVTYFSNGESLNLYGIRGRFTNEYIHLYNKVGIGHPSGWGQGEGNTPSQGLSTYGGINVSYGSGADSTFNGKVNILGSSMYVSASQLHIGKSSSGTAQMSFESWGSYTGAIAMNASGQFHWGGQGASEWYFKTYSTYNGDYSASGNTAARIASDGNIWMSWAGDWLSNLLGAKQNASTAITTSNIGSQSVNYASSAGNADTVDGRHADYFYPNNTDNGYFAGDINGNTTHQRLWGTDSVQNLLAFRPPTSIEYSTDGTNWTATTATNGLWDNKMFGKWGGFTMAVGNNIGAWRFVRMTWVNFGYHFFSHFTLAHSTNGHSFNFVFQKSDLNGVFSGEAFRQNGINSWPGYTFTKHSNVSGWWDTRDIRFVFELNHNNDFPNNGINIGHIGLMGGYSSFTRLYDWDGDRKVYFSNEIHTTKLVDANNNTYYFDGDSLTSLRTRGSWRADSSDWDGEYSGKIQYHSGHWYFQAGDRWYFRNAGGSNVFEVTQGGNGIFNGTVTATGGNSTNWNTAFGWGNHASAGYQSAATAITTSNIASQSVSYADESGFASSAGSVEWTSVQNKPATFPPSSHTHDYLSNNSDSEQEVGLRYASWNAGAARMNTDPRWNESGYDADLGCLHIWAWTAGGSPYGRAGIALYNGSAYQYLTTRSGATGMFVNNQEIIHSGNIGSQSVNYATSAGNADTVDGYHATNAAGGLAVINANGYWYPPSWINVGGAGIYSGTNNAHLLPNNTSPHGAWEMIGSKGGWSGIYFRDSGNTLMANANDSGFYNANAGWQIEWYNGTLSVSKQANGGGTLATVLDSSNFTSWAQTKVYQGQSDGDWQNFTNDIGEFRVDEVLNITSGNHSNYPTGVYTYGGVMSWRGNNHSFQLYASHTGDLTFKTQWGNDNYSGWRNIIHSANIGSQSVNYASSAGNADTVDGYHESAFWRNDQNRVIGVLRFTGEGGDSGNGNIATSYGIYQQGGAWTHPYPDLCIGFHTGIKIGAHYSYGGTRFYNNSDWVTEIFSVGNGDNHVRVENNLYVGNTIYNNGNAVIHAGNIASQSVSYADESGFASSAGSVEWTSVQNKPSLMPLSGIPSGSDQYVNLRVIRNSEAGSGSGMHIGYGNQNGGDTLLYGGGGTSAQLYVYGDHVYSPSSFRAPIFYDSNDTAFYVDPNSNSRLVSLNLSNGQVNAANNAGGRLRISSYTNGENLITGNTHNIVLGPYSTRTGTGYYAGIAINGLMNYNGGTSYDVAPHIWIGAQYRDTPGSERSDFVVAVKSGTGTSGTGSDLPEPRFRVDYEGIATATGSFRAPVFYDSENTGYFLDPNGSSQLNTVYAGALYGSDVYTNGGWFRNHSNNNGIYWSGTGWHLMPENGADFRFHSGSNSESAIRMETNGTTRGYVYADSSNTIGFLNQNRTWRLRAHSGGAVESFGDFRAPIFYDSDNTGYYGDFASTSVMNAIRLGTSTNSGTISGGGDWGIRFANDNGWIQFGPANNSWTHIYTDKNFYFNQNLYVNGTQVVLNSGTWGINVTGSAGSASSSSRSSALDIVGYGNGNMTYYQTSGTFAGYSGWAGYFVSNHGDGATYYNQTIIMPFWGPPQYSRLQGGTFVGPYTFWSTENLNDYAPNMNQYVRTTDNVTFNTTTSPTILVNNHSDNTKGYRIHNTSGSSVSAMFVNSSNQLVIAAGAVDQINLNKKVYINGVALGVNVAASATAGRIDASNDIVAYSSSDERLKENITPIENALDKVKSLTGVEFDWKPEYKHAHGYEGHDTGIIAQQVQAVMPSAVRTNDTGFLAVRYEKLIGLLIEGMKEQQAQIDELKAKLDGLTK